MGKTILYLVLLGLLGYGVYHFLFKDKDAFGVDEAGFTVEDTSSVGKIFMADKSGNTISLERKERGWMINDSFLAIPQTVNGFLATLKTQAASYPVPEVMHNTVIKSLSANAIKVELYNTKGKQMRVFYVGGQANNNTGTYMLVEGAQKPYVVQIPGFEGYVTPRYSTNTKDWRDRTVVNIAPADVKSVSLQYVSEPLNSFTFTQDDAGKFNVSADPSIIAGKTLNLRRATVYSKFFEKLYAEGYLNGMPGLDTVIRNATKRAVLEVTGKQGQKQHVEIYWMPIDQRSKNLDVHDPGVPDEFDSDRFYATMNDFKDTVIIQRFSFDKVFRKAYEFYQEDEKPAANANDTIFPNSVRVAIPK